MAPEGLLTVAAGVLFTGARLAHYRRRLSVLFASAEAPDRVFLCTLLQAVGGIIFK